MPPAFHHALFLPMSAIARRFSLQLKSIPENIVLLEPFVEKAKPYCHVSNEQYHNILLVLTEAVNNSIVHGNRADPDKKVRIQMNINTQSLRFVVQDEGHGFDLSQIPDPTSPNQLTQPNGRGVFLMRCLADTVSFAENGRKVFIYFNRI